MRRVWTVCVAMVGGAAAAVGQPAEGAAPDKRAAPAARADGADGALDGAVQRFELESGVRVILMPIPGCGAIGAQALYPVGFMHDAEGFAQSSHLAEHMVCNAPTESFETRGAMDLLAEDGMANAETLGSMTHYDYFIPPDRLGDVLKVERERLASLRIEEDLLKHEASRCDSEVEFVMSRPFLPSKWALAAANQWWRYGQRDVRVMGSLAGMPVEDLTALIESRYRPDDLLLVLVGDFDAGEARAAIELALGEVEPRAPRDERELDWDAIEREAVVTWDLPKTVMVVAYAPPEDADECLALTALASLAHSAARGPSPVSPMVSSRLSPVGDAPLLFMVQLGGDDPMAEARALAERMESLMPAIPHAQALAGLRQARDHKAPDLERIVPMVMEMRSVERDRAAMMVVGQTALDVGIAETMLGDPGAVERLGARDADWWREVVERHVSEERRRILVLKPGS